MYEKRTIIETRTFKIRVHCDCGGEYAFNGNSNLSYPPQYVHECPDCGHTATFPDTYPMDHTEEVGEPQEIPDE
jgi:hypothetical protein